MSDIFFKELKIRKPDINILSGSGTHSEQTSKIMVGLEKEFLKLRPNLVIVVGDVNSTLASALVTSKLHIPLAHVEAGLRSYDITMPEEINRIVTERISELLFTPSMDANENLRKEGIDKKKIHFTGNIMIDTLAGFIKKSNSHAILYKYNLDKKNYCFITLHRPSNVDDKETFEKLARAINKMSKKIKIIFPVHPRTEARIKKFRLQKYFDETNIIITEPIGYIDAIGLTASSKFVVTDSGGIQEETTYLKVPCLTLRNNTERPVTATIGTNTVIGTDTALLLNKFEEIMNGKYKKGTIPKYWDGNAAVRIVNILKRRFL